MQTPIRTLKKTSSKCCWTLPETSGCNLKNFTATRPLVALFHGSRLSWPFNTRLIIIAANKAYTESLMRH
uniref:Uncharacterized protein n=1 Tax=Oryza brachyantha TaxID=4533 RepID=J3N2S8_ORYBR